MMNNFSTLSSDSVNAIGGKINEDLSFGGSFGLLIWICCLQFIVAFPLFDSHENFKLVVSIIFSSHLILIRWLFPFNTQLSDTSNYCQLDKGHIGGLKSDQLIPIITFILPKVTFTFLWSILWMRWTLACNYFTLDRSVYNIRKYGPISIIFGLSFYLMINNLITVGQLYELLMISFLWYGTGSYFIGRLKANPILLLTPVIVVTGLEIAKSFNQQSLSSNVIECSTVTISILLLVCCLDKSRCIQDLFPSNYPVFCSLRSNNLGAFIKQTFAAAIKNEIDLDETIYRDFNVCLKILKHHCETLTVSLPFYSSSARIDVTIAYAFIRVSDDLVDDGRLNMPQRIKNHEIVLQFMDELFSSRSEKWTYDVGQPINPKIDPPINWSFYKSNLPKEAYQVFKAYSRTVYYQPSVPMKDLISTYSWDLEEKHIANEKELVEFARSAGGGIMATFHCIQMYKSGLYPNGLSASEKPFIDTFYAIGQAMQLVNIARDIVLDSSSDGRCYIPQVFMENPDAEIDSLTRKKDPWSLGIDKLSKYSKLIVALSYYCCAKASLTTKSMPSEVRKPLMIFSEIYRTIGSQILKHSGFEKRIFVPLYRKIWIAFTYLYFNWKHI